MTKTSGFLHDIWALMRPFWLDRRRWPEHLLLLAVIGLNLASVWASVWFNEWYRRFYNAIQQSDESAFWYELQLFMLVAALAIIIAIYRLFIYQWLSIRWRRWMNDWLIREWLEGRAYYRMQIDGSQTDNPDQRVAEDARLFVDYSLGLTIGLMREVVNLVSFAVILWTISGPITLPIFGETISIPGYMVWVALLYAILGTWLMHRIGRPLIRLQFEQQRAEADYRYGLVRFRENAEGVALNGGEAGETRVFGRLFSTIVANWWAIMWRMKAVTTFSTFYAQVAIVLPFIIAAPRYFAGAIDLGTLLQVSNAFGQVQGSLSWFVDSYVALTEYKATTDRLTGFRRVLAQAKQPPQNAIAAGPSGGEALALDPGTRVDLPDGTPLLAAADGLSARRGDRILVTGPSGAGKSTLFRAIAGLWPFGRGDIRLPREPGRVLFLPQRPYLPLGSLREVLAYPDAATAHDDGAIRAALEAVGLGRLAGELDRVDAWARRLSPGEQQRLAIGRALLYRPDWLFMDEPTSALDEETAEQLYRLIAERLPGTTILTVSHQDHAARHHDRRWRVARTADGGPSTVTEDAAQ